MAVAAWSTDLLYQNKEVAELIEVKLDSSSGDDGVDVLNHR